MTVSILVPTLGGPGWDRYLPGLLAQTRPAEELIIIFDRSADKTERRRLRAKWPGVVFLFNDKHIGITASLNRGLEIATGEYIFRCDDDDECRHDRITRQLDHFAATGADFIGSWAMGEISEAAEQQFIIKCPLNDPDIKAALQKRNVLIHSSLAFRKEAVMSLGGYDETFTNAQDYALYLAAIRAGFRFAAVPEPLVTRHYGPESITVSRRRQQAMFSCAARVIHHAHSGNRVAFLKTLAAYAMLSMVPSVARRWRRNLFRVVGRGV